MRSLLFFIVTGLLLPMLVVTLANAAEEAPVEEQVNGSITPEVLAAKFLIDAEKGQPQAMLNLGALYEQGLGVIRNFTTSMEWYEKAALAGEKEGYYLLALCYELGKGTRADLPMAVKNYEKAAELGSLAGISKLASLYMVGRGVAKDEKKSVALLLQAAEAGSGEAANELGYINLKGLAGKKEDPVEALKWFKVSANFGFLEGVKNLGVAYKEGLGQKPDQAEALKWFLVAQKGGYQADLTKVIETVKEGLSEDQIAKNEKEAEDWLATYVNKNKPQ